jgi:glutathione S-transferase
MSAEYELFYWPLAGRGEFIRLLFEEAGVPFKETTLKDYTFSTDLKAGKIGYPGFAPPVIRKGNHSTF